MVQPEAKLPQNPMTPEEKTEAKAEAMTMLSQINYIIGRIQESGEGFMNTAPEVSNLTKKSVGRVLFPSPLLAGKQDIRQWLVDKWGEVGNRMFNIMVEDGGGVHVFFQGIPYPCKGFHYNDTVEIVDEVKKTAMGFLRGFFGGFRKNKIKMGLFVLLFRGQFFEIAKEVLQELDYRMARIRQKPNMYCRSGREVFRTFNKMMLWHPQWEKQWKEIRNIVCMAWEYDDAYRYPAQDVFEEFDRERAKKDIIGELSRLLDIYIERDNRGTAQKFLRIKRLLTFLRFFPKYRKLLQIFILELDVNQIKLDEADCFHSQYKWGYNWRVGKAYQKYQMENPDGEPIEDWLKNLKNKDV